MESIYADDSEQNAIEQLVSSWEQDAPNEPSEEPLEDNTSDEPAEDETTQETDEEVVEYEEEETTQDSDDEQAEDEQTDEEELEADPDEETEVDADELEVEVVVNGESKQVSVKELKRLYGQEAALTQKSQKVAEERKALEEKTAEQEAVMERTLGLVKSRYEQYANVDWLTIRDSLSADEFKALREDAKAAEADFMSVTQEVGKYLQEKETALQEQLKAEAEVAHNTLLEANIGWSADKYNQLVDFAVEKGLAREKVTATTDAAFFLLLNEAFEAGSNAKKATVKKKVKTVKKTLTSKEKPKLVNPKANGNAQLSKKLKSSGSKEDAVALLMSQWEN